MISTVTLTFDLTYRNPSTGALEPRGIVTDSTDYAGLGINLLIAEAKGLGVITFNGDVIVDLNDPNDPNLVMIDLENWGTLNPGQTPVFYFPLELDLNGNVANGVYTFNYSLRLVGDNYQLLSNTLPDTLVTDGSLWLNDFLEAGNTITIVGATSEDVTVISTVDSDPDVTITTSDYTLALIDFFEFDITNTQLNAVYTYSGCTQTTADVSFTYDCEVGDSGSWAVANTTVLKSNEVISTLNCTVSYPSWTALTPTFNPQVVLNSLPYPSAPNTETPLATGTYTVSLTQQILQTQTDGLILQYSTSTIQEFVVSCSGSLCGLTPCIESLRVAHANELHRNRISKYQVFVDNVLLYYAEAQNYRACGDTANYRATIELIKQNLDSSGCECACCDDNTYYWVSNNSGVSVIDSLVQSFQFRLYDGIPADDQDVTQGVQIGALWQDFNTGIIYRCTDNTEGEALWEEFFGPGVVAAADVTAVPSANFLTANNVQGQLDEVEALAIFGGLNGLVKVGNDLRLGGSIDANTTINTGNNIFEFVSDSDPLAVRAGDGVCLTAARAQTANTGVGQNLILETTSTSGNGADGLGSSIAFRAAPASSALSFPLSTIESKWTNATTRSSNFTISTANLGFENVGITLNADTTLTLNAYGSGALTGAVAYNLAVDASGNVIETTASSSALVYTARISGSFAGGVSLIEIENTTGATFTINALLAGYYEIGCSNSALFNRDNAVIFGTLSDGTPRVFTATIATLTAAITIQTLDFSGAPADGINLAMIKIEIYP
jgi:hypothetical protein